MLDLLTTDFLVFVNKAVKGPGTYNHDPAGCTSSSYYYDTNKDIVSSVFYSIVKGHYFSDGNKRTATAILFILSEEFELTLIDDDKLFDAIVEIAASDKFTIKDVSKKLFKV